MPNKDLTNAKKEKKNEFYTQYEDIQREINTYLEYNPDVFRDKTVLLPCDDPEWSNFTKYFAQNFETLGLKKLISTSYATESKIKNGFTQLSIFDFLTDYETQSPQYNEEISPSRGKIFTLTRRNKKIDIEDLKWKYLEGDGDFRSDEIKALRDEADIIITNPPFSLFREFVAWIIEANKQFLIIGPQNAITYKEIFPLIKDGKMWLGKGFPGSVGFFISKYTDYAVSSQHKDGMIRVSGITWYTNLDHGRRHQPLSLMTMDDNIKFSKHKEIRNIGYCKYINYDCLEVKYVDSIPADYDGLMGITPTFLEKYNPDQFEIIGSPDANIVPPDWKGMSEEFVRLYYDQGNTGSYKAGNRLAAYINKDGKAIVPYKRILIRRKQ